VGGTRQSGGRLSGAGGSMKDRRTLSVRNLPVQGVVFGLRAYQRWISPLFPPRCRFYPSCSSYAISALQTHGLVRGAALALWRLMRCQPFGRPGVDHVPERRKTVHGAREAAHGLA
jgi:putative membrane protein insertion efficiency factor